MFIGVRLGSLGSFGVGHWGTLWSSFGVTGFIVVRLSGSSGSFGVRHGRRWVRSGSQGSMGNALELFRCRWVNCSVHWLDVDFVRGHWVDLGMPCESSGSFGVAGFIGVPPGTSGSLGVSMIIEVRPGCHRVCSGSLGLLGCARRLPSVTLGSLRCALGVFGFFRCHWVDWGTRLGSSGSFGVLGFIWVDTQCRRVRSMSLGILGCALVVVVFLGVAGFIGVRHGLFGVAGFVGERPMGRRICSWTLGACLVSSGSFNVTRFIELRPWGLWVHSGSLGSFWWTLSVANTVWVGGYIGIHPGGRRDGSGSFGFALGVIGFMRCCRVHWGGVVRSLG